MVAITDSYQKGAWVYVQSPTDDELHSLVRQFELDPGHVHDAMDEYEIPRLERSGDYTYIFTRHAFAKNTREVETRPILFIISEQAFISISTTPLASLEALVGGGMTNFTTTHQVGLFTTIMDQIIDQYEEYINSSARQIKLIRQRLETHEVNNRDIVDFVLIEDRLNSFLSAMLPTNAILKRLMLGRHVVIAATDSDAIDDVILNNDQLVESCHSNIKSLISIREAYSTIAGNNLSRTMKILTIATMLIALPNVFFGMYGMNIELPFQKEVWAYVFVLGLTATATGILVWLARSRKIL